MKIPVKNAGIFFCFKLDISMDFSILPNQFLVQFNEENNVFCVVVFSIVMR